MVLPIAGQWAVPQYVDPLGARSPEGLLVVLRLADPTVVPPTVAHTAEQPSAEHTEEQPSLLVASIDHIMALVRLQRVSRLGRLPVRRRLRPIATTRLIATQHPIIIRRPGRVRKESAFAASDAAGNIGLVPYDLSPVLKLETGVP